MISLCCRSAVLLFLMICSIAAALDYVTSAYADIFFFRAAIRYDAMMPAAADILITP